MTSCGAALGADGESATDRGKELEASSSTGAGSVKGAALARTSFGGAASCEPCQTTELEVFTRGAVSAAEGLAKLASAAMPITVSTIDVATHPATSRLACR
jgi:hypothetical protein